MVNLLSLCDRSEGFDWKNHLIFAFISSFEDDLKSCASCGLEIGVDEWAAVMLISKAMAISSRILGINIGQHSVHCYG